MSETSDTRPNGHDEQLFQELIAALPGAVALFDPQGALLQANDEFLRAVAPTAATGFEPVFGAAPDAFVGGGEDATIGGAHLSVRTSPCPPVGWLCQLHDVSRWVDGRAEAEAAAARDELTGLFNRGHALPEVARALEDPNGGAGALLMIDLDRFKGVNDTLGHAVGDQLLVRVARRLEASVRPGDMLARLGGDEFAVLQRGVPQPAGAEALAKRIVEVVARPYIVDGHMIDIGASVGVALPREGEAADALFKQADIALYRAKQAGRGRYTFFEQRMDEEMQERRELELDLRRAIAFREFELYYQPQMDLASRTVTGMEALIRWHHPRKGLISPAKFIPVSEETGLIVPIGEWVIRQACEDAARWGNELSVAVNVSAKQLFSGKLVGTVKDALLHAGISPRRFEVEITESVLMLDNDGALETLHALRDVGVRISMDDFGTGYSSLSYLRSFPFDKIKIDQSFVRSTEPEKAEGIIRAIAAVGEHLGMSTIAEGVETAGQLGQVELSGCGSVQGYLLSEPVPAHQVPALLERLERAPFAEPPVTAPVAPACEAGLYRLVYYSRNMILGVDAEVTAAVDQILRTSQANNAAVGVTGALMFTDGFFAQILEGQAGEVERVFERIQLDDRHGDVQLLAFQPVETRVFGNWSMAFVGAGRANQAKFGHYAATTGFDFEAADADAMTGHLRSLLVDEERLANAA